MCFSPDKPAENNLPTFVFWSRCALMPSIAKLGHTATSRTQQAGVRTRGRTEFVAARPIPCLLRNAPHRQHVPWGAADMRAHIRGCRTPVRSLPVEPVRLRARHRSLATLLRAVDAQDEVTRGLQHARSERRKGKPRLFSLPDSTHEAKRSLLSSTACLRKTGMVLRDRVTC